MKTNNYTIEALNNGNVEMTREIEATNINNAVDTAMMYAEDYESIVIRAENGQIAADINNDGSYTIY